MHSESLRVAIIAGTERQKLNLKSILENNHLDVVTDTELQCYLDSSDDYQGTIADVLLVDLDEESEDESGSDALNFLLEKTDLPILFNDSAATRNHFSVGGMAWGRRLANKLKELVDDESHGRIIEQAVAKEEDTTDKDIDLKKYERKLAKSTSRAVANVVVTPKKKVAEIKPVNALAPKDLAPHCAKQIWVLGASHGGPQAVKEFLSALPPNLSVGFVLAQHIGGGVVPLLVEQLDRICVLNVERPRSGRVLKNGELLVSPVDKRVSFDQHGHVILKPIVKKTTYSPSIDLVFQEVAQRFGVCGGGIIFSGMGNDGMHGVQVMRKAGGTVWAQNADSCVISSMADSARKTGAVQYSASPTALAKRLAAHISKLS